MNNISDERIKELREWLKTYSFTYGQCAEILTLLDDYSSLRAENERLLKQLALAGEEHDEMFAEKAEAQLIDYAWLNGELIESKKKAEAELARQAPLIEAVMGAERLRYVNLWKNLPTEQVFSNDGIRAILRAAHALREEK